MQLSALTSLAELRLLVGFLGEKDQFAWWKSSFFGPGCNAFLAPAFPRTQLLAQYEGISRAAALLHDDHIGVGEVCHLFRLPEDLEQAVHRLVVEPSVREILTGRVKNREVAVTRLREMAVPSKEAAEGAVRAGSLADVRGGSAWRTVAAHYLQAFDRGVQAYPFFSNQQ